MDVADTNLRIDRVAFLWFRWKCHGITESPMPAWMFMDLICEWLLGRSYRWNDRRLVIADNRFHRTVRKNGALDAAKGKGDGTKGYVSVFLKEIDFYDFFKRCEVWFDSQFRRLHDQ